MITWGPTCPDLESISPIEVRKQLILLRKPGYFEDRISFSEPPASRTAWPGKDSPGRVLDLRNTRQYSVLNYLSSATCEH
jgi:hypothetical protein